MSAAVRLERDKDPAIQRALEVILDAARSGFTGRVTIDFLHGRPKGGDRVEHADFEKSGFRSLTATR